VVVVSVSGAWHNIVASASMTLMKRSCIFSALVYNESVDVLLLVFTTAVIGGGCLMIMIMMAMMSQRQRQRPASPSTSLPPNNRRSR